MHSVQREVGIVLQCSEQTRMLWSVRHLAFNKRRLFMRAHPKVVRKAHQQDLVRDKCGNTGCWTWTQDRFVFKHFGLTNGKEKLIIVNVKSCKNRFSAVNLFFLCFETGSYWVAQANLELTILLLQSPRWDYRHVASNLTLNKSLLVGQDLLQVWGQYGLLNTTLYPLNH